MARGLVLRGAMQARTRRWRRVEMHRTLLASVAGALVSRSRAARARKHIPRHHARTLAVQVKSPGCSASWVASIGIRTRTERVRAAPVTFPPAVKHGQAPLVLRSACPCHPLSARVTGRATLVGMRPELWEPVWRRPVRVDDERVFLVWVRYRCVPWRGRGPN